MKIKLLEEISRPLFATKGEIKDVHEPVAIDLIRHGYAELVTEADEPAGEDIVETSDDAKEPAKPSVVKKSKAHHK